MTNDEVKKIVGALRCCRISGTCDECMFYPYQSLDCTTRMGFAASDLIEHQSAEIEALKNRIADMSKAMMYNAKQYALRREHGHWCYTDAYPHHMYCSECHKTFVPNREWVDEGHIPYPEHCPHCGAKMEM